MNQGPQYFGDFRKLLLDCNDCIFRIRQLRAVAMQMDKHVFYPQGQQSDSDEKEEMDDAESETESETEPEAEPTPIVKPQTNDDESEFNFDSMTLDENHPENSVAYEDVNRLLTTWETLEQFAKRLPQGGIQPFDNLERIKAIYQEEQQDLQFAALVETVVDKTNWNECNFANYLYISQLLRPRNYNRRQTLLIPKVVPYSNWNTAHPHKVFEKTFSQVQKELKTNKTGIQASYLEQGSMSSIIELKFGVIHERQFIVNQKMLLVEEFGHFEALKFVAPHEEWTFNEEMGERKHPTLTHYTLSADVMRNLFYHFSKFQLVFDSVCNACRKNMKDFLPPLVFDFTKTPKVAALHENCR